ncbi:MAG: TerB family tellurite resistance protein [Bdellovibrionales bacterium]|nr:TerB family tellurite resistance protein [Bdellovibrionales bacterium]
MNAPQDSNQKIYELIEKTALTLDKSGTPTDSELKLAIFLLLGEISDADQNLGVAELREIVDIMAKEFQAGELEITQLAELAHDTSCCPEKRNRIYTTLLERLSKEQRIKVLSLVWQVILADGLVRRSEIAVEQHLCQKLELSKRESEHARALAEARVLPEGFEPTEE